jgi:3-hydroxy-9,10-secoandrosta-1,3,5(10)-triene-9,17-dione monooxygenase
VSIDDKFIPDYRVAKNSDFQDGIQADLNGREGTLYQLPFGTLFPGAINAATLSIAQGALGAFVDFTRQRVTVRGTKAAEDSSQLTVLGEAAADIRASVVTFLDDWNRLYDLVDAGKKPTPAQRLEMRANSVRAVRRSVEAVDKLFMNAGGGSLQRSHPLQRFWRDAHAGMNHISSYADPMYVAWARNLFGLEFNAIGW